MSIFGKIFKAIGGAVTGFVTGGPLGAVGGAIKGVMSKPMPAPPILKDSTASFLRSSPIMPGGGIATPSGVMGAGGGLVGTALRSRRSFASSSRGPRAQPKKRKFVIIGGRKMTRKQAKYFGGGRRRK